jgi:hypothetical protein
LSNEEVSLWSQAGYAGMVFQDGSYLLSQNFVRCKSYPNVYILRTNDSLIALVMYVDDFMIIGSSTSVIVVSCKAWKGKEWHGMAWNGMTWHGKTRK